MKYRRHGVKREHSVLADYATVYERLAKLPGAAGVIPGRIAHNPTHHPGLVFKGATQTGFKLLAKTTSSIQEVFLIAAPEARAALERALAPLLTRAPAPRTSAAPNPARGRARPRSRPNPGVVPAGPTGRPPLRYTSSGRRPSDPAGASLGEQLADPALRLRLLVLRLRRARWRRRFGTPPRRAPKRPPS